MSIPFAVEESREKLALLYHELRPDAAAYSYVLACARFEEHLQLIRELPASAYQPVITFDDGHISNFLYAMPAMEKAGRKAHFFITAGWTGTRADYMSRAQVRALYEAGHTIGAHGWTHTLLTQCTPAELRRELYDARSALEDATGAPVTSLSLPGGRSNSAVKEACREAGYTTIWTSVPEPTRSETEATIGRFNILSGHSDAFLQRLLDPTTGELSRASRVSRWKATAQRVMGDATYARLWALLNHKEGAANDPGAHRGNEAL